VIVGCAAVTGDDAARRSSQPSPNAHDGVSASSDAAGGATLAIELPLAPDG
jgi:hypothetical protein